jgi:uncharacterized ion transporter superfamily protein YfcC
MKEKQNSVKLTEFSVPQAEEPMSDQQSPQPFLPRVSMIWFFVVAGAVAAIFGVIRAAEQGRELQAAFLFTALLAGLFGLFSALSFLAAYLMGAVERAVVGQEITPASPFSDGSPPPQIIPPKIVDGSS